MELARKPERLSMDGRAAPSQLSGGNVFTPLLEDTEDISLNVWSPNVFKSSSDVGAVSASASKSSQSKLAYTSMFNETLLASPNPGAQLELMYEEVTPVKRDLFGGLSGGSSLSASGDDSSDTESSESPFRSLAMQGPSNPMYNLKQYAVDPNCLNCPSCNKDMKTLCSPANNMSAFPKLNVREVHRHFGECLSEKKSAGKSKRMKAKDNAQEKDEEEQIEADIASNIARVQKAIGMFELQDRIKIMESLYRLGRTVCSTPGPSTVRRSSLSSLYESREASANESSSVVDRQVLSLMYTKSSSAASRPARQTADKTKKLRADRKRKSQRMSKSNAEKPAPRGQAPHTFRNPVDNNLPSNKLVHELFVGQNPTEVVETPLDVALVKGMFMPRPDVSSVDSQWLTQDIMLDSEFGFNKKQKVGEC